jgi:hypothetical protein
MIRVEVADYCQDCLDFSPEVTKPIRATVPGAGEITFTDTIIQCEYRKRCAGMMRYLKQKASNENA